MYLNRITVSTFITTVGATIAYFASAGTVLPQIALLIGLSSLTVLVSQFYQEYKQQKSHMQNLSADQKQPLEPIEPRVDNGLRGKAKTFQEEIQSRNSLLGLNELALSDDIANECQAYVFLRFEQLGQADFDATYPDLDALVFEVLSFVGDNRFPVADIARKLGFNDDILAIMESNPREVEDDRALSGGRFRRHEHAFHAQFHVLSEIEKQKLLKYIQLVQTKHNSILGAENFILQAKQTFGFLADLCQNFRKCINNLDKLIVDTETELATPSKENSEKVKQTKEPTARPSPAALEGLLAEKQPTRNVDEPSVQARVVSTTLSQDEMRQKRLAYYQKLNRGTTPHQQGSSICQVTKPANHSQKPGV